MSFQFFKSDGGNAKSEYTVAEFSDIGSSIVSTDNYNLITTGSDGGFYIEEPVVFESESVTNTNSVDWTQKIFETVRPLAGGLYLVDISYGWSCNSTTRDLMVRFLIDGVQQSEHAFMHRQEAKDSSGTNVAGSGTDQSYGHFSRFYMEFTIGETPDISLDLRSQVNNSTVSMWDAVIAMTRVKLP